LLDRGESRLQRLSANHDLIGQQGMAIGEIQHRLLRELLGVIGTRSTLKDNPVIGTNDMKVAYPATRLLFDVPFEALGKVPRAIAPSEAEWVRFPHGIILRRHTSLPGDRHGLETVQ